jgi:hypothetical protein
MQYHAFPVIFARRITADIESFVTAERPFNDRSMVNPFLGITLVTQRKVTKSCCWVEVNFLSTRYWDYLGKLFHIARIS